MYNIPRTYIRNLAAQDRDTEAMENGKAGPPVLGGG